MDRTAAQSQRNAAGTLAAPRRYRVLPRAKRAAMGIIAVRRVTSAAVTLAATRLLKNAATGLIAAPRRTNAAATPAVRDRFRALRSVRFASTAPARRAANQMVTAATVNDAIRVSISALTHVRSVTLVSSAAKKPQQLSFAATSTVTTAATETAWPSGPIAAETGRAVRKANRVVKARLERLAATMRQRNAATATVWPRGRRAADRAALPANPVSFAARAPTF